VRVLVVGDVVCPDLHGPGLDTKAVGIDVVISCGDLPFDYLEYLVTFLGVPLLYVRGNHDPPKESQKRPRGCIELDGNIEVLNGVLFAGFPGCVWYSNGVNQYTESQMRLRTVSTSIKLYLYRLLGRSRRLVFVSHAAPNGVGDAQDKCHRGFISFLDLARRHSPEHWVHGHVHLYRRGQDEDSHDLGIGDTRVVNAYGYRILDI
jgi:Icc-related predicted phosphoesterase